MSLLARKINEEILSNIIDLRRYIKIAREGRQNDAFCVNIWTESNWITLKIKEKKKGQGTLKQKFIDYMRIRQGRRKSYS